jgi:hypothetical protein
MTEDASFWAGMVIIVVATIGGGAWAIWRARR